MANLSKIKRDNMIAFLEELKKEHSDDASIRAFNEIENHLRDKKYGLIWEEHSEAVNELLEENIPVLTADPDRRLCKDETLPWNFIIEGDNLQALYLLEKTHRGKVDCIYIDPPYNSGARDWKYNNDFVDENDVYRHSKWLSMMKTRLQVAKNLLNTEDSVLICTIDEKEYLRLGCLLEEMFPTARIQMISSVINPSGVSRGNEFYRTDEYIFFVKIGQSSPEKLKLSNEWLTAKNTGKDKLRWRPIRRQGSHDTRDDASNQFYPIFITKDGKKFVGAGETLPENLSHKDYPARDDVIVIWPLKPNEDEGCWQISQDTFAKLCEKGYTKISYTKKWGYVVKYLAEGEQKKVEQGQFPVIGYNEDGSIITEDAIEEAPFIPGTQWRISSHSAREFGSSLINKMLESKRFSFPKSLYAVKDALRFFLSNKPSAIVVDFFAGSGTTMHAINLLNAEDDGKRRCIMVTNNEVSESEANALTSQGFKKGDMQWEKLGIAKYVTWPRTVCSIEGKTITGNPLNGAYITSIMQIKEMKRNIKQISFIDLSKLSLQEKRKAIRMISGNVLPGNLVNDDTAYVFSDDPKHNISILIDASRYEDWLGELYDAEHIEEFYVLTQDNKLFKRIKKRLEDELGTKETEIPYTIPMSHGFNANVKYFKCDWTPRKPEDYLLSNVLCLHIREMIELQNAIEIDNVKNVLILNKSDFKNIILNPDIYDQIEHIWVNQNIILNAEELKLLEAKGFKYIPREFFGHELREAAE